MHYAVKRAFERWHAGTLPKRLAYLGSYDMNGTIDAPHTGFDIVDGPGVDVALIDFKIPRYHLEMYDAVASISSFQFCPHPDVYLREAADLLERGGRLFLTMCGWHCRGQHGTSNELFDDSLRLSQSALVKMLASAGFEAVELEVESQHGHEDFIATARKLS